MSNEEMSEELREAIQRGLEASVAPGADIHLTYEESEALWATSAHAQSIAQPSVIRNIRIGPAPLHRIMELPETRGVGTLTVLPLYDLHPVVSSKGAKQVPVEQPQ